MASRITLVVSLYVHNGRAREFEQFESAASKIMSRYGGRIDRRIRLSQIAEQPYEVHLVTFPDEQSFQKYRDDPELSALAELRQRAIQSTKVWIGSDVELFEAK